jgi:hypothetical protein
MSNLSRRVLHDLGVARHEEINDNGDRGTAVRCSNLPD